MIAGIIQATTQSPAPSGALLRPATLGYGLEGGEGGCVVFRVGHHEVTFVAAVEVLGPGQGLAGGVVEVAEASVAERGRAAAVAGGEDVAALEAFGHPGHGWTLPPPGSWY